MLIADDDTVVRDVVRRYLERDGLDVSVATRRPRGAARYSASQRIDVAVLDVMMPGPDGLTLCRTLRDHSGYRVPVILLTALSEEDDRIAGPRGRRRRLRHQAVQPAGVGAARALGASSRRAPPGDPPVVITVGDLTVSAAARSVTIDGLPVSLTNREFDLLLFFLTHTDVVFSREELLKRVWQWDFGDLSTVTVHVKRLQVQAGRRTTGSKRCGVADTCGVDRRMPTADLWELIGPGLGLLGARRARRAPS